MDVYEALYTTRAMRRLKTDPIPAEVQAKILDAAIRAPTGGNSQNWRFLLVDDPALIAQLGAIYRRCIELLWSSYYKDRLDKAKAEPELAGLGARWGLVLARRRGRRCCRRCPSGSPGWPR